MLDVWWDPGYDCDILIGMIKDYFAMSGFHIASKVLTFCFLKAYKKTLTLFHRNEKVTLFCDWLSYLRDALRIRFHWRQDSLNLQRNCFRFVSNSFNIRSKFASNLFHIRFEFGADLLQIRSEIHFKFQTSS